MAVHNFRELKAKNVTNDERNKLMDFARTLPKDSSLYELLLYIITMIDLDNDIILLGYVPESKAQG